MCANGIGIWIEQQLHTAGMLKELSMPVAFTYKWCSHCLTQHKLKTISAQSF